MAKMKHGAKKAVRAKAPKAAKKVEPIPSGYAAITPYLRVRGAAQALEFYKKAFGAKETVRMAGADGQIMHAELKLFNTVVMLGDDALAQGAPSPQSLHGTSVGLFVHTRDVEPPSPARSRQEQPRRCPRRTCSGATASDPSRTRSATTG